MHTKEQQYCTLNVYHPAAINTQRTKKHPSDTANDS